MSDRNLSQDVRALNAIAVTARTIRGLSEIEIESSCTRLVDLAAHCYHMANMILRNISGATLPLSAVDTTNLFGEIEASAHGMRFAAEASIKAQPQALADFSEQLAQLAGWIEEVAIRAADREDIGILGGNPARPRTVATAPTCTATALQADLEAAEGFMGWLANIAAQIRENADNPAAVRSWSELQRFLCDGWAQPAAGRGG